MYVKLVEYDFPQRVRSVVCIFGINFLCHEVSETLPNVANHFDISDISGIAFARLCVNMDEFFISIRVPEAWMVFDDIVTDSNDEVCPVETAGDEIVCLQTDTQKRESMGPRNAAFAHKSVRNRNIRHLRELC